MINANIQFDHNNKHLAVDGKEISYIAQIIDLWETNDEEKIIHGRWFYQPAEIDTATVRV